VQSLYSARDAASTVARYETEGVSEDVALRVYTTRLLGGDPRLVLHGGGNTSVKTAMTDILGDPVDVLRVKGSGWDMADIEPSGLPAVRLEPLRRLAALDRLGDEEMVDYQRGNLLDSRAPNPSTETLLHAFIPLDWIDHSHADAILTLTNQPDGASRVRGGPWKADGPSGEAIRSQPGSLGGEASVDHQLAAREVGSFIRGEEEDRVRDLVGGAGCVHHRPPLRVGSGQSEVAVPNPVEELPALLLEAIDRDPQPLQRLLRRKVHQHVQVRLEPPGGKAHHRRQLAEVEPPPVALVRERRGGEAVGHHVTAGRQRPRSLITRYPTTAASAATTRRAGSSPSGRAPSRISIARPDRGTRCSRALFIRLAGIVHTPAS